MVSGLADVGETQKALLGCAEVLDVLDKMHVFVDGTDVGILILFVMMVVHFHINRRIGKD